MKNPQNGDWYLLAYKGDTHFITVTRSPRCIVRAWHGYSDMVLVTAGGYGCNKESSVLAEACATLVNQKSDVYTVVTREWQKAAGVGIETLKRLISESGGKLYDRTDALDLIHKDIKANNY